ncbi:MAG: IgGFc-binding protein, partial [Cryomorphaceae bacterium]|nr:IgGFc-binding protein [Cryomorphaceae bacterium]
MKKLIIVCFFLCATFQLSAQLDTVFWFVAPEVAQQHGDRPIVFRFATLANPATITISQPANPLFPTQVLNLAANSAQTLDLTPWIDIVENKPANTTLNYGFKISATANITAYYEVNPTCACNPDIFSLKGKNSVGTSFITPFQNFLNNASYARSAFNIVATQDNTTITIIPTQNIVGHAANVPFNIVLNKGQTYSAENVSILAGQHLGGSVIISDKPIAVTLSDDTAQGTPYGGCADLMGDQLIPTSIIGSEYIAIKGYLNGPDKLYIVAATNGTQITIDGAVVGTINATQTYVHTLSSPTAYIQTSEPAYVLHQSGFGCEVGEAILPPIVCTGSNVVPFVRSTNEFFALNILVPTGGENSFVLNGNPALINPASFNFVPGTANTWKYAQIDASAFVTALQNSRLENTVEKFHLGLIHGGASSGCRFGYFSDFASYRYEIQMDGQSYCTGDDINFTTNQLPGATYQWTGPNGYSATGVSVSIPDAQLANAGQYIVSGNLPNSCELLPDSVLITIVELPSAPQLFTNGPVCADDSLLFWNQVNAPLAFTWYDEAGNTLAPNDTIAFYPAQAGSVTISLTANVGGCVSAPTSTTV